ncbi:hypothetical protein [Streptococcus mutans]|jgi:hypothetical protein|nr:hypothetical protein [Streptococcus mutans]EMB64112.1 hypothetical protein SMU22_06754 [Streptococcus mutans 4SM1]EMB72976.1 hypothetical protein SMU40_06800 [Streptococcus mutans 15VF2]EMC10851.1 hypothetical protein SMU75_07174 [Streptococcus mutans N3209]EMC49541.1 hypothetical protein SMU103_02856 [Streptococcus mutans SA38]MCB4952007.1 hypothetical protein [Streptococcus mutans]
MKEQIKEMMPIIEFDEITSEELNGDGWFIAGAVTGATAVVGAAILT